MAPVQSGLGPEKSLHVVDGGSKSLKRVGTTVATLSKLLFLINTDIPDSYAKSHGIFDFGFCHCRCVPPFLFRIDPRLNLQAVQSYPCGGASLSEDRGETRQQRGCEAVTLVVS